jgi:peptidoglycan/LPS O-acetylase OafA/YrhL
MNSMQLSETSPDSLTGVPRSAGRIRNALTAVWGGISGIAPHVLHHVGPLAGAAILAGTAGRLLFFFAGLAAAVPMLIRLYRRFGTWVAPAIATGVFVVAYLFSSIYLGPLITGNTAGSSDAPAVPTTVHSHDH